MALNSKYSDNELLQSLKDSNDSAFTEIYHRYWKKLYVVAMHRLGNLEEAKEVVQDVFCNLWNRRSSLQINYTLNTYLSAAVKYEVLNRLASKGRELRYQEYAFRHWREAVDSTQNSVQLNELQDQLASLVRALPRKCRIVFQLSRDRGYSQKQIAAELGIAEKTVEAHLSLALRKLRTGLSHFFTFLFFFFFFLLTFFC